MSNYPVCDETQDKRGCSQTHAHSPFMNTCMQLYPYEHLRETELEDLYTRDLRSQIILDNKLMIFYVMDHLLIGSS